LISPGDKFDFGVDGDFIDDDDISTLISVFDVPVLLIVSIEIDLSSFFV
jgi:hypothetical protein